MNLLLLSGFLGQPQDFNAILKSSSFLHKADIRHLDVCSLHQQNFWPQLSDREQWSNEVCQKLDDWHLKSKQKVFAIGYSLGGRILLHLADKIPHVFKGLVFLSTNPCLLDTQERQERWQNDLIWSKKFESKSSSSLLWSRLMSEWNNQSVFAIDSKVHASFETKHEPSRIELNYNRDNLSLVLKEFSLSKQKHWRDRSQIQEVPQLWLVGEADKKFIKIMNSKDFQKNLKGMTQAIPGAGHRLIFSDSECVVQAVEQFFQLL